MKTEYLHIRITEEEKKKATEKAESLGLSLSSYMRMLINIDTKK